MWDNLSQLAWERGWTIVEKDDVVIAHHDEHGVVYAMFPRDDRPTEAREAVAKRLLEMNA